MINKMFFIFYFLFYRGPWVVIYIRALNFGRVKVFV